MSDSARLPDEVRSSTSNLACDFLAHYDKEDHVTELRKVGVPHQKGNLQAVLLATTLPSRSVVKAHLSLAFFQRKIQPSDILRHVLELVLKMKDSVYLRAEVYFFHGRASCNGDRYKEAKEYFQLAREDYLNILNMKNTKVCLLRTLQTHSMLQQLPPDKRRTLLIAAHDECKEAGDQHGTAYCFYLLGKFNFQYHEYTGSIHRFHEAIQILEELGNDPVFHVEILYELATAYFWHPRQPVNVSMA
ncbi:hypothetical protein H0H87_002207 [Tephrocybe sp. NHM501043]|nr:hypothetical protein H0H87_002207 [Tephrocybe sp. NHM501043]